MCGDVIDPFAVDPDLTLRLAEPFQELRTRSRAHAVPPLLWPLMRCSRCSFLSTRIACDHSTIALGEGVPPASLGSTKAHGAAISRPCRVKTGGEGFVMLRDRYDLALTTAS